MSRHASFAAAPSRQNSAPAACCYSDEIIRTYAINNWQPLADAEVKTQVRQALERGAVLHLPDLQFPLSADELRFVDSRWSNGKSKNIGLRPGAMAVRGAVGTAEELSALQQLLSRYAQASTHLVQSLLPQYTPYLTPANTSLRPNEIAGRTSSWRKDDTRLHVDAFPSNPLQGRRLLRVFHNLNPSAPRVWRVGKQPFSEFAEHFVPTTRGMFPGQAWLMQQLRLTKQRRSEYDHRMLQLHDRAKNDLDFQATTAQQEFRFAPGATWLVFSDQVLHSVLRGQGLLEQSFYLEPQAIADQSQAPLAVLTRLLGRPLT